jgi:two-component system LytT family response regulator
MTHQPSKMTAVIVDDESLARAYLKEMLSAHLEIEIVGECANGFDAVRTVVDKRPDLLFLDIEMPKLSGFEVLEALEQEAPRVIFVTAFDEYAVKAFEVHAADYLLKPFSKDRLDAAIKRLFESERPTLPKARDIAEESSPAANDLPRIIIRDGGTVTIIAAGDVDFITSEGDYVSIRSNGRSYLKLETISAMADLLNKHAFARIHRGCILNLDRLEHIDTSDKDSKEAVLKDGTRLPISRSGYKTLMEQLESR